MKDILFCEYSGNSMPVPNLDKTECFKIIQTMDESGKVTIGKRVYPMTHGGLYFIDGSDELILCSENMSDCIINQIIISKSYIERLADLLEFADLLPNIFPKNNGFYVPLKNNKGVTGRFKRMCRHFEKPEEYSKARITTDIIALINYAVYMITK